MNYISIQDKLLQSYQLQIYSITWNETKKNKCGSIRMWTYFMERARIMQFNLGASIIVIAFNWIKLGVWMFLLPTISSFFLKKRRSELEISVFFFEKKAQKDSRLIQEP